MRLAFIEQGRQIGEVRLVNGELAGSPIWVPMVQARMERWNVDAEEALRRLDGWSNGYLAVELHTD